MNLLFKKVILPKGIFWFKLTVLDKIVKTNETSENTYHLSGDGSFPIPWSPPPL